jgi:energy-coupling factor transporter ATP-binding protein EcfA2
MRVISIRLRNFKRFTDLTVKDIPASAKLVVVVGPNGCGKSSLFDALLTWYGVNAGFGGYGDEPYFRKDPGQPFGWHESVEVTTDRAGRPHRGALYVRSAYRNDPDFSVSQISRPESLVDQIRFRRLIENDQTVGLNYQRLVYETLNGVYSADNDAKSVAELRNELIGDLQQSLANVFGDLKLNSISDPLGQTTFLFDKGTARRYHYKNLSAGEKAAFDLLLDLHIKKRALADTVYCIDEIETHLHTKVQGTLLKEIVRILPDQSQLWVTTHSLGVLRAAEEMSRSTPGSVAIIDFDGSDPDFPREIAPSNLGRIAWEKMLSIALDDLSELIAPGIIVVCEGSSVGTRRKDFDAEIYNRVLGSVRPDTLFVAGGSSSQVAAVGASVRDVLAKTLPRTRVRSLVDRDSRTPTEVADYERTGDLVLPRRNLETYLLADDVLTALAASVGRPELAGGCIRARNDALAASSARGNPADDTKSAAGQTYTAVVRILGLTRAGNNTDTFMRDTLAPLIRPGMATFEELKAAVTDRL